MILPGSTVKVIDENSIYRGYVGCVQRIQGKKAAVLMDSHTPWDKMITFRISSLDEVTEGFQYYPKKKKRPILSMLDRESRYYPSPRYGRCCDIMG